MSTNTIFYVGPALRCFGKPSKDYWEILKEIDESLCEGQGHYHKEEEETYWIPNRADNMPGHTLDPHENSEPIIDTVDPATRTCSFAANYMEDISKVRKYYEKSEITFVLLAGCF